MTIDVPPPSFKWKVRDVGIAVWSGAGEGEHDYVIGSVMYVSNTPGMGIGLRRSETVCAALAQAGEGKVVGILRNSKVLGLARPSPPGLPADVFAFVYTEQ